MSNEVNEIKMLPLPSEPRLEKRLAKNLIEKLRETTLENLVEERVEEILNWEKIENPILRRRYRNYSLVYSRSELQSWTLVTYQRLLHKYEMIEE